MESIIQTIPHEPGTYLLWLCLPNSKDLTVGKLGRYNFPPGDYVYLGSARGPGGLRARLGRHLRGSGRPHWHIDRLRAAAQVRGFGYQLSSAHTILAECVWSQKLAALPGASLPASGFGASDCHSGCTAHLVRFPVGSMHAPGNPVMNWSDDQDDLVLVRLF